MMKYLNPSVKMFNSHRSQYALVGLFWFSTEDTYNFCEITIAIYVIWPYFNSLLLVNMLFETFRCNFNDISDYLYVLEKEY